MFFLWEYYFEGSRWRMIAAYVFPWRRGHTRANKNVDETVISFQDAVIGRDRAPLLLLRRRFCEFF